MGPLLTLIGEPPPGDEDSCYIDTPLGVSSVLRSVAATGSRAVAYLGDDHTFIHTSLLAVEHEPPVLLFEKGPDTELNQRVLTTVKLTMVTSDHGVPVQFGVPTPTLTDFEGTEAFCAPLPRRILRLQRRGNYRLPGEPVHSLLKFQLVRGDRGNEILTPPVMDVSCGGLSIALPVTEPELTAGSQHACTLEIPVLGKIETIVEIHASFAATLPGNREARRYGVEFINLEARHVALIQRYILYRERMKKKDR